MPKCTVLYIKVHCHNGVTKPFFPPRTVKAPPFIFTSETRECNDARQMRAQRRTRGPETQQHAGGEGGLGGEGAGRVTVGKAWSQPRENRV